MTEVFCRNLRKLRESAGYDQDFMAGRLNISKPSYYDLEDIPSEVHDCFRVRDLRSLCDLFHTSVRGLFSEGMEVSTNS